VGQKDKRPSIGKVGQYSGGRWVRSSPVIAAKPVLTLLAPFPGRPEGPFLGGIWAYIQAIYTQGSTMMKMPHVRSWWPLSIGFFTCTIYKTIKFQA
jgi:hypothetical protein